MGYGSNHGEGHHCPHSDHYSTKTAAKDAAKRMGLSGCHKQQCKGETVYMPGKDHGAYEDATQGYSGPDMSAFGF